jgi:amino acid adenylation domain-containing protein
VSGTFSVSAPLEDMDSTAIIELGKLGFFFENNYEVEANDSDFTRKVNLISTSKKSFCIRLATLSDLDALDNVEEECWGALRVPREELSNRLTTFPRGQWVATVNGTVQGVLYTQRVPSVDCFEQRRIDVQNQLTLHSDTNPVLQLVTVSVLPGKAQFSLGSSLRNFVVLLGRIDSTISSIMAVTRCSKASSFLKNQSEYEGLVFNGQDPIVQFHVSSGAELLRVVPGYRKNDIENYGNGILLTYSISHSGNEATGYFANSVLSSPIAGSSLIDPDILETGSANGDSKYKGYLSPLFHRAGMTPVSIKSSSPQLPPIDYWGHLREIMLSTCQLAAQRERLAAMGKNRLTETSFMDLGYDSLDLMAMRFRLVELLQCDLPGTVLFDFPTPKLLLKFISSGLLFDGDHSFTVSDNSSETESADHFAICGMGCRFPGQTSPDPASFFQFLCSGKSAVTEVPEGWKTSSRHAAFLDNSLAETFDPGFFGLSASEAESMDPNQRILLEVCHEALQSSNRTEQSPDEQQDEHRRQRTGVFVGICNNEWISLQSQCGAYSSTGVSQSIAANRISYCFNLGGPSLAIDTACSSSFAALHTACNSIRAKDCDIAVVAASDLILSEFALEIRECSQMLAPDGKTKSFDANANGYVRGEGAGAIVIKRLSDALANGEHSNILAVVRGSSINQDGRSASLTAPNGSSQRRLLRSALHKSGLSAGEVAYVETHGTGTKLGDPIEFGALKDVYLNDASAAPLIVGAVKTNIGHLEGAAGMAGLIKAILSLQNRVVPANLNLARVNPLIPTNSARQVVFPPALVELTPNRHDEVLAVGISSFGSGGTNGHVILEGAPVLPRNSPQTQDNATEKKYSIGFIFSGQGTAYDDMGLALFQAEPAFRDAIVRCSDAAALTPSLIHVMYPSTNASQELSDLKDLRGSLIYSHLSHFALQVALVALWKTRGVECSVVCGHSLGEFAALVAAGGVSCENGVNLVLRRAQYIQSLTATGAFGMYAFRSDVLTLRRKIATLPKAQQDMISVAAVNSSQTTVLSGDLAVLESLSKDLGVVSRRLPLDIPYHSHYLTAAANSFRDEVDQNVASGTTTFSKLQRRFVSCLQGSFVDANTLSSGSYWQQQMLSPVNFIGCVQKLAEEADIMIEIGPHPQLTKFGAACVDDSRIVWIPTMEKQSSALEYFNEAVGKTLSCMSRGRLGGRMHPTYNAQRFPWRQLRRKAVSHLTDPIEVAAASTEDNVATVVKTAIQTVLLPSARQHLSDDANLLTLGIDSLAAVSARNQIAKALDCQDLPPLLLISCPAISQIVEFIGKVMHCKAQSSSNSDSVADNVSSMNSFSTTSMQRGMVFHHLNDPSAGEFLATFVWTVRGPLNMSAFRAAWVHVANSISALRSSLDMDMAPVAEQVVAQSFDSSGNWFTEASVPGNVDQDSLDTFVKSLIFVDRSIGIDLSQPHPFRVKCIKNGSADTDHIVLFTIFHAFIDGWSLRTVLRTLSAAYEHCKNGASCAGIPKAISANSDFHIYAKYEWNLLTGRTERDRKYIDAAKVHWKQKLAGWDAIKSKLKTGVQLKIDCLDSEVIRCESRLEPSSIEKIRKAAQVASVTLASLVQAAWCLTYASILESCDGRIDMLYGCTTAGRSALTDTGSVENVVGPLINTFPVRFQVDKTATVRSLIADLHAYMIQSVAVENFPLASIIQQLSDKSGGSLFSVVFDYQTQSWDCDLVADGSVTMRSEYLLDRVGVPVSCRVLQYDDIFIIKATSECLSFGYAEVNSMLQTFRQFIGALTEACLAGGDQSQQSIDDIFRSVELSFDYNQRVIGDKEFLSPSLPSGFIQQSYDLSQLKHSFQWGELDGVLTYCNSSAVSISGLVAATFSVALIRFAQVSKFHLITNMPVESSCSLVDAGALTALHLTINDVITSLSKNSQLPFVGEGSATAAPQLQFVKGCIPDDQMLKSMKCPALLCSHTEVSLTLKLYPGNHLHPVEVYDGIWRIVMQVLTAVATGHSGSLLKDIVPHPIPVAGSHLPVSMPIPSTLLHEPFNEVCIDMSRRSLPAVITESGYRISHEKLQKLANRVASGLISISVKHLKSHNGEEGVVAVIMEKGWEQVVASLGILKAHGAYLPIDAKLWPEQRIRQVLDLSGAIAVVTQEILLQTDEMRWLDTLHLPIISLGSGDLEVESETNGEAFTCSALSRAEPQSLAYLIYTSGSTGVPKGVCCHHVGAMNTIVDLNQRFHVTSKDSVLALSSLGFDLSVYDIFGLLSVGGSVVIPPASSLSPPDPSVWLRMVTSENITIWNTVPAFMELLVGLAEFSHVRLPACLRLIFMSGDWIPTSLPNRIRQLSDCPELRIISMGGATEAAIWSNIFELGTEGDGIPRNWSSIPYGQPMRNQSMYILNDRMEHCDVWVTGVIYIGGVGVANGYYKNPERTAYQFVRHPVTGEKLFRTGDLGRVRPGGLLEILGREDTQVKVNGFRIELGEIEKELLRHPNVASVTLTVHNNLLCAYIVFHNKEKATNGIEDLRRHCLQFLAEYMRPHHFMVLDEFPLSSNGKVDKSKLPEPLLSSAVDVEYVEAKTPVEISIRDIFATILGVDARFLSIKSNFFALGGDSLRSVQVIAQARKKGIILTVPQIFAFPTIGELAQAASMTAVTGPTVLGTSSESVSLKPIFEIKSSAQASNMYPLIGINQAHYVGLHTSSFTDGGLAPQIYFEWVIGGRKDGNRVQARLDVARFEKAINIFIKRHSTFQSVVTTDGRMRVLEPLPVFKIMQVYEYLGDESAATIHAEKVRKEMMAVGPSAYSWPLFEIRVTHLSDAQSVVHLTVSLFLMDAMSDLILRQELSILYRALGNMVDANSPIEGLLPQAAQISFPDYCRAIEDDLPKSSEYIAAKEYWMARLPHLFSGPQLPMVHTKSKTGRSVAQDVSASSGKFCNQHRWLTTKEWSRAKANCAAHAVTMPTVLLAAYCLALSRWSSNDKFLINILQCLRHQVHEDVNKLVGNCSSTILCNVDLSPPADPTTSLSFRLVIQRVAQELSQNLQHASFSGVEVMQELNRVKGNTFQAVAPFIFTTPIGVEKGNQQVQSRSWMFQERFFSERVPHTACVNAIKNDPNGTACASLDIVEGTFPPEVISGIYEDYLKLLDLMCSESPKQWNMPVKEVLNSAKPVESYRPPCDPPNRALHEDIVSVAAQRPSTPAVFDPAADVRLDYELLSRVSNKICRSLAKVSYGRLVEEHRPQDPEVVAVIMEKGWQQMVAVLGILKAGCAYLPIDAKLWPEHRVREVLALSSAVAVVTQERLLKAESTRWLNDLNQLIIGVKDSDLTETENADETHKLPLVDPKSLAYLIYTSGSTGVPKGVSCHHLGAMNTIADLNEKFEVTSKDKVLALSSLGFDLSVYDIFGLLGVGGAVVIPPPSSISPPDPSVWMQLVVSEQITVWNTVPAFMELMVSLAECSNIRLPACLRLIFMSGDWIPVSLPARIRAVSDCPNLRIISMGGATEAAIWSNIFELGSTGTGIPADWSSIPYGKPMRNQTMYILNERMEHCEAWVTGVIYIGGVGVANGYYKNPERTAYQFVTHPVTGEKLFRTGDLGRVRPGGLLEILGREDLQVKVNGFRIELGEIEKVLLKHNNVSSAALAVHKNSLCAYLVLRDKSRDVSADLRKSCKLTLADYMVPHHFIVLDELPLSSNGKVLQDKLPSPFEIGRGAGADKSVNPSEGRVSPRNALEGNLLAAFSDVLRIDMEVICCESSNFFELGGNSLSAIQLMFLIRKRLDKAVSHQDFFQSPTIAGVAKILSLDDGSDVRTTISMLTLNEGPEGSAEAPVFVINPAGASALWYVIVDSHFFFVLMLICRYFTI